MIYYWIETGYLLHQRYDCCLDEIEQQGSLDEAKRNPGSLVYCSPGFRCTSSRLRVAVFNEEGDSPEGRN
ncbi:MAG: hypothetical protein ABW108_08965 [Candidatus Thiodiazotropha sp. 6PLUC10]